MVGLTMGRLVPLAFTVFLSLAVPRPAAGAFEEVEVRYCRAATGECRGSVVERLERRFEESLRPHARRLERLVAGIPSYEGEPWEPVKIVFFDLRIPDLYLLVVWQMATKATSNRQVEIYRLPRQGPIVLDLERSVPAPNAEINLEETYDSWEQSRKHYVSELQWPKWTLSFGVDVHPLFASPREVFLLVESQTGALNPLFATETVMLRLAETVERMLPPGSGSLEIVDVDDSPPAELLAAEWAWADYFLYKIAMGPRITKIFVAKGGRFVEACKRYEDVYREEIEYTAKWVEQRLADPGLWQVPELPVDLPRLEAEIFEHLPGMAPKRRIPEGHAGRASPQGTGVPPRIMYRGMLGEQMERFSPRPGILEEVGEVLVQRAHVAEAILDGLLTSLQVALFDEAERFYRMFERLFEGGPAIESAIAAYTLADMRKTIEAMRLRADRPCVLSNYRHLLGEGLYAWLKRRLAEQLRSPEEP